MSWQAQAPAEDSEEDAETAPVSSAAVRLIAPHQQSKQRKKKKKKGKGDASEEAELAAPAAADEEDLDKLLSDLNIHLV